MSASAWAITRYAAVRPIFNLIDGITYESGTGTQSDPIRIA